MQTPSTVDKFGKMSTSHQKYSQFSPLRHGEPSDLFDDLKIDDIVESDSESECSDYEDQYNLTEMENTEAFC